MPTSSLSVNKCSVGKCLFIAKSQHGSLAVRTRDSNSKTSSERGVLPSTKHKDQVDQNWRSERQQDLSDGALLAYGVVTCNAIC